MDDLLRRQYPFATVKRRQFPQLFRCVRHINRLIFRRCLIQQQRAHISGKFYQDLADIFSLHQQFIKNQQRIGNFSLPHCVNQFAQNLSADDPPYRAHHFRCHGFRHDAALFQQAQRIAHAAFRCRRDQFQRFLFRFDIAAFRHLLQMRHNFFLRNGMEIKPLATGMNRRQNLLRFRRRQNEHHMIRRLFQRLQQRVAGFGSQHMGFVYDIDFVPAVDRRKIRVLIQIFDVVHTAVGSRVQFLHVQRAAVCNLPAVQTLPAGTVGRTVHTVQRLGKDAGRSGLARTAGACEQVGVRNPAAGQRVH